MRSKILCLLSGLFLTSVASAQSVPHSSHVWMITEENHSYEDVLGSPQMPYYNQLISQYGLAAQFYSDQHSSLPALMWFVAGAPITRNNDTISCEHGEDNVVRELLKEGYTWRSYQEDLPYPGFQRLYGGKHNHYYRRHNPLIDFTDVCPGTGQENNSVPYSQMAKDFEQGNTVNYAYITPDVTEDAHSSSLEAADRWLQEHVPQILARPEFSPGGDGILFIVWDEGTLSTDKRCSDTIEHGCGGRTATLVIGPQVTPGYQSTITYHNENVLATVCAAMGLSTCPGAAQNAAPMADFFSGPSDSIVISRPEKCETIDGAVHLIAHALESIPLSQTQVWDNGVKLGVYGTHVDAIYKLAPGKHTTTILDLDSFYKVIHQSSVTYIVQAHGVGVKVTSPTQNETLDSSNVHVVAHATESVTVSQMQVWDNGVKLGRYLGKEVDEYFHLAPGSHTVTVTDLDSNYTLLHLSCVSYSVQ